MKLEAHSYVNNIAINVENQNIIEIIINRNPIHCGFVRFKVSDSKDDTKQEFKGKLVEYPDNLNPRGMFAHSLGNSSKNESIFKAKNRLSRSNFQT